MLHFLSAPEFDPDGFIAIDPVPDQTPGESRRRVTRVATLDGSAVFNDFGFCEADRIIELRWVPRSRATELAVDRLVQLYERVIVATPAGVFRAAPEVYIPRAEESTLRLLVESKLSE